MRRTITFKLDDGTQLVVEATDGKEVALLRDVSDKSSTYGGWISVGALADLKRRSEIIGPAFRERSKALFEALCRRGIASTSEA